MNANIIKTHFFHNMKFYLEGHTRSLLKFSKNVLRFFTMKLPNPMIILTFIFMENFCPCLSNVKLRKDREGQMPNERTKDISLVF